MLDRAKALAKHLGVDECVFISSQENVFVFNDSSYLVLTYDERKEYSHELLQHSLLNYCETNTIEYLKYILFISKQFNEDFINYEHFLIGYNTIKDEVFHRYGIKLLSIDDDMDNNQKVEICIDELTKCISLKAVMGHFMSDHIIDKSKVLESLEKNLDYGFVLADFDSYEIELDNYYGYRLN